MTRIHTFMSLYDAYSNSAVDSHIDPEDSMNIGSQSSFYMAVGQSAAAAVTSACIASRILDVTSVLDLPCGHGRVLRHLSALFPKAKLFACDLDRPGVDFCARQFGATPIYSTEDLTVLEFNRTFDLIWVGSLFTHLSQERTFAWLKYLCTHLSPQGIVVATFHGRYSAFAGGKIGYIDAERWAKTLEDYNATGYGYQDYEVHGHAYIQGTYGVSLASPAVLLAEASRIPDMRIFSFVERGWADHQDVLVIGRPSVDSV
jgi:SAM-dependent methyltransferase